jgi:hypothetical protein
MVVSARHSAKFNKVEYRKLRMRRGSLWTKQDAAWIPEGPWVLTQMLRKPFAQLLRDAVFPIPVGRDLRVRRGEGAFALATYHGSTLSVHVEMAARQKGRSGIMVYGDGRARRGKQARSSRQRDWSFAMERRQRNQAKKM